MPPPQVGSANRPVISQQHKAYLALVLSPIVVFTIVSVLSGSHAYNVFLTAPPGSALEESGKLKQLQPIQSIFAQKSNWINVYFIKYAWAWTTLAWLAQLWTLRSPVAPDVKGKGKAREYDDSNGGDDENSSTIEDQDGTIASPLAKSLLRYLIATFSWIVFATWFFGPSIIERIMTSSGGVCLPHHSLTDGISNLSGEASQVPPGAGFSLPQAPIDAAFCRAGKRGISREERPDIFRTAHLIVSDTVGSGRLRGKWKGGHDVSGHVFILALSSLFLLEELSPYLVSFFKTYLPASLFAIVEQYVFPQATSRRLRNPYLGSQAKINTTVTIAILALIGLWLFSLVNTSLFFHTPQEKVSGALLAVVSWAVLPKGG
ncbi:unnamed protein product [Sympodiomycopsis kandeliae]